MAQETKRLTIDISPQTHRQLKTLASFHGQTMKEYLLSRALSEDALDTETQYLLQSPKNRARLLVAVQSDRKKNKTFKSVAELRHALGI